MKIQDNSIAGYIVRIFQAHARRSETPRRMFTCSFPRRVVSKFIIYPPLIILHIACVCVHNWPLQIESFDSDPYRIATRVV